MGNLREGLGSRLRQLRESAGLTQEALARQAAIQYKYLADVERGRKSVSLEVLEKLMRALDAEPFEMFAFSLQESRSSNSASQDVVQGLLDQCTPEAQRLAVGLLKGILRWQNDSSVKMPPPGKVRRKATRS